MTIAAEAWKMAAMHDPNWKFEQAFHAGTVVTSISMIGVLDQWTIIHYVTRKEDLRRSLPKGNSAWGVPWGMDYLNVPGVN